MSLDSSRFAFIAAALDGSGPFRPSVSYDTEGRPYQVSSNSVLVAHPREKDAKFAYRNALAWYENHLRSACQRFVGYLAKKPPLRETNNPLLEAFAGDCDWRGNALDVFWQNFMINARARGSMLLLVEGAYQDAATLADQIDSRAFPYLVPIKPEHVVKFTADLRGRINFIEIETTHDGQTAVKGWDTQNWWVRIGDKRIAGDAHGLTVCPVLAFTESSDFPHIGDFAQIADLSRRMVNAWSELTELQRQQGFAVMHYHVPMEQHDFNAKQIAEEIGTNNMLIHRGDAPGFIAPPEGPAKAYFEEISKLEAAIKRISLDVEIPNDKAAESGIALNIRFQALNSSLSGFARRMEDFERRVLAMVCLWIGIPGDRVSVSWAKDYAIADLKAELETLGAMQLNAFPHAAIRQQQKQVAALAFSSAQPDTQQAIFAAIDEGETELGAAGTPADPATGDAGPQADNHTHAQAAAPDMQPIADAIAALKPPVVNTKVEIHPGAIQVTMPEAAPVYAPPQSLVVNTGSNAKIIDLVRDSAGNVTGAEMRELQA